VGCPIRRPRDHRSLASPPGFSQRAASFIASQCQGIHQMPLSCARSADTGAGSPTAAAAVIPGYPPRTGANPARRVKTRRRGDHEDTFPGRPGHGLRRARNHPSVTFTNPLYPSNNTSRNPGAGSTPPARSRPNPVLRQMPSSPAPALAGRSTAAPRISRRGRRDRARRGQHSRPPAPAP
jgi:hypothetical protein